MKLTARALGLVGLLGGSGGAINASLCYANLPVPVGVRGWGNAPIEFIWSIIPAGALHGALLAMMAVGGAWLLRSARVAVRLTDGPPRLGGLLRGLRRQWLIDA